MKKIGKIFIKRRKELGFSIFEISEKIKLSVAYLNAIENGDINFFRDDISYLKYFVRYYANVLHLDYGKIKNFLEYEINNYTQSLILSDLKNKKKITETIKKKIKFLKKNNIKNKFFLYNIFDSKKSFVLLIIIFLIMLFLFFLMLIIIFSNNKKKNYLNNLKDNNLVVKKDENIIILKEKNM